MMSNKSTQHSTHLGANTASNVLLLVSLVLAMHSNKARPSAKRSGWYC